MNHMYINPALVTMFLTMLSALILVGGVLWKLASMIGDVKRDVAVIHERLDGHIKNCNSRNSQT